MTRRLGLMLKQKLSRKDVYEPKLSDLMSCFYAAGRHGYKLFLFEDQVYMVVSPDPALTQGEPYFTGFTAADVERL